MSSVIKDEMQGSKECGDIRPFSKQAKNNTDERINPS